MPGVRSKRGPVHLKTPPLLGITSAGADTRNRPLQEAGPKEGHREAPFTIDSMRRRREAPAELRAWAGAYRITGCDALSDGSDTANLTAAA